MRWHEWICHTYFSFLVGASSPRDLILKAIEHGYSSLAITDFDGVYGLARAYRALKLIRQEGIQTDLQLIYGAELHFQQDHDLPIYFQDTLVLLALDLAGYFNLCKILSAAHENESDVRENSKSASLSFERFLTFDLRGVVGIQPMRGRIRSISDDSLPEKLGRLKSAFAKECFFLGVSCHCNPAEDTWIDSTLELAKQLDIPVLLTQDLFFHSAPQKQISDVLQAIRLNQTLDEVSAHLFVNDMRSPQTLDKLKTMYSLLPCFKEALLQAEKLATRFHFDLSQLRYHYPQEFIPEGYTADEYLEVLTWRFAKQRYGDCLPDKIQDLLNHELKLVKSLGFSDYFLTVYDIVRWARSQDILCQGRGSAANSAICFVLGITAVDPVCFELLFERFISVERGSPPDIDVDFEHERREEVIQYIYSRYGRDRAAMVCTVITFRSRGALRFTGKALGMPTALLDEVAKTTKSRGMRGASFSEILSSAMRSVSPAVAEDISPYQVALWANLAERLRGFPRHLGIHSGGFLVSHHSIFQLCPIEPATMTGRSVIQWSKEDIEALYFFKIDILALGGLTLIKKCFQLLQTHYQISLSLDQIPLDDPATYAMIQKADTVGTFQIESRAQMSFLPRHQPKNFYDLVVEVAIIRPGPIQGGMIHPYLRRRNGEEPVTFPDPRLEPILKRTYGVPIFQEQVMRVAMAVGGFSAGEADELRKNIGAFSLQSDAYLWVNRLAEGMRRNGIQETFVASILGHIKGFASYGFPESHATSFALLAYATSYLKCHYPTAFFAAILQSQPMGFYTPDTLIKVGKLCGVQFLPICIQTSRWDHHLENVSAGGNPEWAVRLGFQLIRGLHKSRIMALVDSRPETGWADLMDCLSTKLLTRSDLTGLAASHALFKFGLDRKSAIWLAEASPFNEWLHEPEENVLFPAESAIESVQLDYHITGTSLGTHPTELIRTHAWRYPVSLSRLRSASETKSLVSRHALVTIFGMVTCRQSPGTAKGIIFVTMWDDSGSFDLVIKPDVYRKYRRIIDSHAFLCVDGRLQSLQGGASILVTHIYEPVLPMSEIKNFKNAQLKYVNFQSAIRQYK